MIMVVRLSFMLLMVLYPVVALSTGCTEHSADSKLPLRDVYEKQIADENAGRFVDYSFTEAQTKHLALVTDRAHDATQMMRKGENADALNLLLAELGKAEKVYKPDDPQLAKYFTRIVECYRRQNQWAEAEKFARRLVATRDKWLPKNCSDTMRAQARLAEALRRQGKAEEAYKLMNEVVAKADENNKPGMVVALEEQALDAYALGRADEGDALIDRSIKISEEVPEPIKYIPRKDLLTAEKKIRAQVPFDNNGQN